MSITVNDLNNVSINVVEKICKESNIELIVEDGGVTKIIVKEIDDERRK